MTKLYVLTDDDGKRFVRIPKGEKTIKVFLPKTRAEKILEWDAPIEPNTVEMEDINF